MWHLIQLGYLKYYLPFPLQTLLYVAHVVLAKEPEPHTALGQVEASARLSPSVKFIITKLITSTVADLT